MISNLLNECTAHANSFVEQTQQSYQEQLNTDFKRTMHIQTRANAEYLLISVFRDKAFGRKHTSDIDLRNCFTGLVSQHAPYHYHTDCIYWDKEAFLLSDITSDIAANKPNKFLFRCYRLLISTRLLRTHIQNRNRAHFSTMNLFKQCAWVQQSPINRTIIDASALTNIRDLLQNNQLCKVQRSTETDKECMHIWIASLERFESRTLFALTCLYQYVPHSNCRMIKFN